MDSAAAATPNVAVALPVPAFAPHGLRTLAAVGAWTSTRATSADVGTIVSAAPVVAVAPTLTPFQGPFGNPFAAPARPLEWPKIAPYTAGQGGDSDGLRRNVDGCNMGCIGGRY